MHEHYASAYARASVEHGAPAYATDGRTNVLTQMHSPEMNLAANASRAGGLEEVIPSDVLRNLANPLWLRVTRRKCDHRRTA